MSAKELAEARTLGKDWARHEEGIVLTRIFVPIEANSPLFNEVGAEIRPKIAFRSRVSSSGPAS